MINMKYFLLIVFAVSIISCDRDKNFMPSVSGKAGEIVVVMDKPFRDGDCGKTLQKFLRETYPQLPQEEPLFDVVMITSNTFNSLMKTHRSILYCKIGSDASKPNGISTGKNVWASPQLYMEINASDAASFIAMIEKNYYVITEYFTKGEQERLTENYRSYSDKIITRRILDKLKLDIAIPKGYKLDVDKNDFTWITNETQHTSQGILIYYISGEYGDSSKIHSFLARHDSVLKENVPASVKGSWMTTEREIPVTLAPVTISDIPFKEIRGLWRAENDFMGGPFIINYTFFPESNQTLVLMGYVYAPRFDKRTYVQQVEAILYSTRFTE
jgi:hypothetical protein